MGNIQGERNNFRVEANLYDHLACLRRKYHVGNVKNKTTGSK